MVRFSSPVRFSSTAAYWPASPIRWRRAAASRTTSSPTTVAVPASGMSSVVSTRTSVVLPAPLGPSRPRTVPLAHVEIDAVEGAHVAEGLDDAADDDRRLPVGRWRCEPRGLGSGGHRFHVTASLGGPIDAEDSPDRGSAYRPLSAGGRGAAAGRAPPRRRPVWTRKAIPIAAPSRTAPKYDRRDHQEQGNPQHAEPDGGAENAPVVRSRRQPYLPRCRCRARRRPASGWWRPRGSAWRSWARISALSSSGSTWSSGGRPAADLRDLVLEAQVVDQLERVLQRVRIGGRQGAGLAAGAQALRRGGAGDARGHRTPARQVEDRDQPAELEVQRARMVAAVVEHQAAERRAAGRCERAKRASMRSSRG